MAGRPKGSRKKATLAVEACSTVTRRSSRERLLSWPRAATWWPFVFASTPPRKDRPVPFALRALGRAEDASASLAAIVAAVASGELTPGEAGELSKVVDTYVRALLATELEALVTALGRQRK